MPAEKKKDKNRFDYGCRRYIFSDVSAAVLCSYQYGKLQKAEVYYYEKGRIIVIFIVALLILTFVSSCASKQPDDETTTHEPDESVSDTEYQYSPIVHTDETTYRGQEENESALASPYTDIQPVDCVGVFGCPLNPWPSLELREDGSFFFCSGLSSYKTSLSGTYTVEGNQLHLETKPDFTSMVYTLTFSFP